MTEGVGVVTIGWQKRKCLVYGTEWNISFVITYFWSSYITEEEINTCEKKQNKTVVSMLSCGALGRSNNPYIESIVGPYFSKNQKEIYAVWVWFWRKPWKRLRQWKKVSMSRKRNLYTVVLDRKKNCFEISVIILRYIRNVNLSSSKMILNCRTFYKIIIFSLLQRPS